MGGKITIPAPDERVKKSMILCELSYYNIGTLWDHFQRISSSQNQTQEKSHQSSSETTIISNSSSKNSLPTINIEQFCNEIDEEAPSSSSPIYVRKFFEFMSVKDISRIQFGEFVHVIITMCLFEKQDILKFCFYVFAGTRRKRNFINDCGDDEMEIKGVLNYEELNEMLDLLHNLKAQKSPRRDIHDYSDDEDSYDDDNDNDDNDNGVEVGTMRGEEVGDLKGTEKIARIKMEENIENMSSILGGQIELNEMKIFMSKFPRLFYPVFRIQNKIMSCFFGFKWWDRKKRSLERKRKEKEINETKKQLLIEEVTKKNAINSELEYKILNKALQKIHRRRIRRELGYIRFYMCWCQRRKELNRVAYPSLDDYNNYRGQPTKKLTREEQIEKIKQHRLEEKRLIEHQIKNPETEEWRQYIQSKKSHSGEKNDTGGEDNRHSSGEDQRRKRRDSRRARMLRSKR